MNQQNPIDRRSFLKVGGASAAARATSVENTLSDAKGIDAAEIVEKTKVVFDILSAPLARGEVRSASLYLEGDPFCEEDLPKLVVALSKIDEIVESCASDAPFWGGALVGFVEANGLVLGALSKLADVIPCGMVIPLPEKLSEKYRDSIGTEVSRESIESFLRNYEKNKITPFESYMNSNVNHALFSTHLRKLFSLQLKDEVLDPEIIRFLDNQARVVVYEESKVWAKCQGITLPEHYREGFDLNRFISEYYNSSRPTELPYLPLIHEAEKNLFSNRASLRVKDEQAYLCISVNDLSEDIHEIILNAFGCYPALSEAQVLRLTSGERELRIVPEELRIPSSLYIVLELDFLNNKDASVRTALDDMKKTLKDLEHQPLKYSSGLTELYNLMKSVS